jgi:hypothetical protein
MTPWPMDRLVGTAVTSLIELFLLWRIWRSLRLRSVPVRGEGWTVEQGELGFYRLLVFCLILSAVAMGGIIALIAGGFVSLDPHNAAGVLRITPAPSS